MVDFREQAMRGFFEINDLAQELIESWRNGSRDILTKVNANGVKDVVTEVDREIEQLAIGILKKIDPSVEVFGEESFRNDFSVTRLPRYFVIDPIDGTKEFINGSNEWSISLCLVEDGEPTTAMISMPDKHSVFSAIKGKGAYLNEERILLENIGSRKIGVSPRQIREEPFRLAIANSGFNPVKISALTPKICALLKKEIDAAVYFPQKGQSAALWDYAAAVLLTHEAGGKITSLCGNELPFTGKDIIHKKGWLASSCSEYHTYLLSCLKI